MTLTEGQLLQGRYQIERLVARGGYGAVYKAFDVKLKCHCAIKENLLLGADAERQLEQEAQILARLRHPNLPLVFDHFLLRGQGQYLIMEYIEGRNLHEVLRNRLRPFSQEEALPIMQQLCAALAYLHSQTSPIVHRDVKPQNIVLTPGGSAILVDFGVSKVGPAGMNTVIGSRGVTPGYASPEQYGSDPTDARCDVYSAGATLYTLLTGERPVDALDRVTKKIDMAPIRQSNGGVSPAVETAVNKAMEVDLARRTQSIEALARALAAAGRRQGMMRRAPWMAASPMRWLAALLLVAGGGAILLLALGLLLDDGSMLPPSQAMAPSLPPLTSALTATPAPGPTLPPAFTPTELPASVATRPPEPTFTPALSPPPAFIVDPASSPTFTPTRAPTSTALATAPAPTQPIAASGSQPAGTQALTPPAPTPVGGGQIVFEAGPAGSRDSYRIAPDGSQLTNLTNHPADDMAGSFSPPDGRWLLFSSNRDGNWDIYAQDLEQGGTLHLTEDPMEDHDPAWSPDGRHILFHSNRSDSIWRIYSMALNGDDLRVLTHDERGAWAGDWSQDGRRILFSANFAKPGDIYAMDADGGSAINLTNSTAHESTAQWSPNGRRIVFYSERDGDRNIYVMDANGGNVMRLTGDPATDTTPNWSPDGKQIVFASDRGGGMSLYILDLDSGNVTLIPGVPADASSPSWYLY